MIALSRTVAVCAVALGSFAHAQQADDARWWAGFATQGPVGPGVVFAAAEFQGDYYIGGSFTLSTPDGVAKNLARWDGRRWGRVPGDLNGAVYTLCVFEDGSGPALFVGGALATVNINTSVNAIARWNGATWATLAGGMTRTDGGSPSVEDIVPFDPDGAGPAPATLIAVGSFQRSGGVDTNGVASWNGSQWSAFDSGLFLTQAIPARAYAARVWDPDGAGGAPPSLIVAGQFSDAGAVANTTNIARWQSGAWSSIGGLAGSGASICRALEVIDLGAGPRLIAGGLFTTAGGQSASNIAAWDGASWAPIGGITSPGGQSGVESLRVDSSTQPPTLLVGGQFTSAGATPCANIARWNGVTWAPLGAGLTGESSQNGTHVFLLDFFDEGCGPVLFAGGSFTRAGDELAVNLARFDSSGWSPIQRNTRGLGLVAPVASLCAFDDGAGPRMHVFGSFSVAGDTDLEGAARWDDDHWTPLGSGLFPRSNIGASLVHDDGAGPALYAGEGTLLTAGGVAVKGIARWKNGAWSGVGTPSTGVRSVYALCEFDDHLGPRPALYVGGTFTDSGGVPTLNIARWDGSAWSALGSGVTGQVTSMCVYDDGGGPALYVGGQFTSAGGVTSNRIARWDGATWFAVGDGTGLQGATPGTPTSMAVFDEDGPGPNPPALFVAGSFFTAGGVNSQGLARWNGRAWSAVTPPMSALDGVRVNRLLVHDDGSGPALHFTGNFLSAGATALNHAARWDGVSLKPLASGLAGGEGTALASLGADLFVGGTFVGAGAKPSAFVGRWQSSPFGEPLPFAAGDQPSAIALANFDRDALSRPDLAVINAGSDDVTLLFNTSTPGAGASFTAPSMANTYAVGDAPRAAIAGDFDGANGADLAVVNSLSNSVTVLRNTGAGTFTTSAPVPVGALPVAIAMADVAGGPAPDLLVVNELDDTFSVLINNGAAQFAPAAGPPTTTPPRPSGIGSGDLDNDKDVDVVIAAGALLAIYPNGGSRGVGAPIFFPITLCGDPEPRDVIVADIDGDGFLDVVTANAAADSISVFLNAGLTGADTWAGLLPATEHDAGSRPVALAAADFYNDGRTHLVAANATPGSPDASLSLFRNVGAPGAFALDPAIGVALPPNPADAAAADLNRDGLIDLALANGVLATDAPRAVFGVPSANGSRVTDIAGQAVVLVNAAEAPPPCPGDANGDGTVDFLDLNIVLSNYGTTGAPGAIPGDLDHDGDCDFVDLNIVLSNYGVAC